MGSIREMLNPHTVALIGATEKENSIGRAVLANLLGASKRPLYPVNPKRKTVSGIDCFPSIKDVPAHVSLAVIITPAATVPGLVKECGEAGVAGAIILSSGFGEAGPRGKEMEAEIVEVRRKYGIRIIGPNCLGVILPHVGLNATFLTTNPKPGKIALISRALGDAILDWGGTMGIGFSMFASLGSMIDVGYGDLIDFLSEDYNTQSLMIYMENVGDAKRFISAARGFALRRPIVVLKPGRSKTGARFIDARTGRQTGDDRVYDAVFKRVGAVRVREVSDLFNVSEVLDSRRLPRGPKLAIITNAGDVGIMATDVLTGLGGELADISGGDTNRCDLFVPEQWSRDDPVDMMGGADTSRYVNTVEVCVHNDAVDGILVIYTPRAAAGATDLARAIVELSGKTAKPIIVTWIGGERASEGRRMLLTNGVPAYETPEEAVKTYLYMYNYRRNIQLLYETPAEVESAAPLRNYLKAAVRKTIKERGRILDIEHSLDLLKNYRIPSVGTAVVTDTVNQTIERVRDLDLPLSLTVRHKYEDREDEIMTLITEEELSRAGGELYRRFGGEPAGTNGRTEIILQKKTFPDNLRLKLESWRDPEFRTVLALSPGAGGPEDPRIGLPPLNQTLARRLLEGTGVYTGLKGSERGQQVLARLEDILLGASGLVVDFPEIEKMSLTLSIQGPEVLAEDVKVILAGDYEDSAQYPHLVIAPYPSHYTAIWNLPDGTEVILRPVRPEDEPMSREMLATLSEESLRVRFFVTRKITHELLIQFCNIDYDQEVAIIAEIRKDGKRRMIGGSSLIREADSDRAEFAVLVHDDYQRMGLGAKLIDVLIGIAQEKRLEEIHGTVLTENHKMLALCRKMGFNLKLGTDGVTTVSLPLKP